MDEKKQFKITKREWTEKKEFKINKIVYGWEETIWDK